MTPTMPPRPCAHPSCPRLVTHGSYCPIHQKQRERAKNAKRGSAINTHLRNTIRARDGYRCRLCGSTVGIEVHHIRALADGGHPTDPSNLILLCRDCHRRQHGGNG